MTTETIKAKCGHAVAQDGCMDCLEAAMLYDEARKTNGECVYCQDGCMDCLEAAMLYDEARKTNAAEPAKEDRLHEGLSVGRMVWVYDHHRFGIPLKAEVVELSAHSDGVRVRLLQSNNVRYPVGYDEDWFHAAQCRTIEISTDDPEHERKTIHEVVRILSEHAGEAGKTESHVDVARRLSNFWKQWDEISLQIRKLNERLGS